MAHFMQSAGNIQVRQQLKITPPPLKKGGGDKL